MEELKTLSGLEKVFKQAIELDEQYIGIKIHMSGLDKPEVIINPKENFVSKLEYYKSAYNEDLTLKSFKEIKIIEFIYGSNFQEIQDILNC